MKAKQKQKTPILLVEDDENDALFMRRAFQKADIPVDLKIVSDGSEALAYFRGEGEYANREKFPFPYLILLDLNIPYVHGLDVLLQIKRESPKTIVLIFTSSAADSDIDAAYELGANSFLLKPSTVGERLDLVKILESYWLKRNQFQYFTMSALH